MQNFIDQIWNSIDSSLEFKNKIIIINEYVKHAIPTSSNINHDMNYSAAQSISLYFATNWQPIKSINNAQRSIKIWISSKIPFFTLKSFIKNGTAWWPSEDIPLFLTEAIAKILLQFDYKAFPNEVINNVVNEYVTDLDGKPASFFEIFFSEIE